MQTAKSSETFPQQPLRLLGRKVCSLPVLLGVLLVAGACADRYANVLNVSLHQHIYSAYCFEGDMWWHLAVGKWILKTHTWPTHDFYSFTGYGNPWIAGEWLGEVLMAVVWGLGGIHGFMLLLVVLAGMNLLLLYYYAYLGSGNVKAAFLACALLLPLASLPFSMRPQMLGYAFLIITLISLKRFRQGHRKALWILPPLFLLWVNTHGTFVLGFIALAVYWATGLREYRLGRIHAVPWTPRERRHLSIIFLLCLLACLITPYGSRLAAFPIQMSLFLTQIPRVVPEWHSLNFSQLYGKWFLVLLILFSIGELIARKTYQMAEVVLLLFATAETFLHARFMLLFVPVFAPLLAQSLAGWIPKRRHAREHYFLNFVLMAAACCTVVFFFPSRAKLRKAVALWSPVGAVRYLRAHPVRGHMLNYDDWGGYLIETLGQKVFIDGRSEVYEPGGVLTDYLQIFQLQPQTLFLLRKYQIRSCLIPPDSALGSLLAATGDWKVAYRDKTSVLFLKTGNASMGSPDETVQR